MSYIFSVGKSIPSNSLKQDEIKQFVQSIFQRPKREVERLLPVFDHANISQRQFVVGKSWFAKDHTFAERNHLFKEKAIEHSLQAIDTCLSNQDFLLDTIPYEAVDCIIYVSSTGISTPSIEAYIMNNRNFRNDVVRMPLWGLGCAGGASALGRAHEWLASHTNGCVLIVNVELCSLTFQKDDNKKSNFIGTALFGDGISATVVLGEHSKYITSQKKNLPRITHTSSRLMKDSEEVMGWDITNKGFEVVFAKSIPQLVRTFWKEHVTLFLEEIGITKEELAFYIAHPGGQKVLQAIEEVLGVTKEQLLYSYNILYHHGNMSSVTVFYILEQWMKEDISSGTKSILSALGPGFSSELVSLEWS